MARLKDKYVAEVAPALFKKFGYTSTMQVPKIEKVVVNVGCGEARENAKVLEAVVRDLSTITGQKAIITNAKKSVANFKLRKVCPSARRSPSAAIRCGSSSIVSLTWRFPVSATSAASARTPSTAAATMPSASRSS